MSVLAAVMLGAGAVLAEARWLSADADPLNALLHTPGECLAAQADPLIETGRAAFRSPLLFGGAAARAGLSCQSCHRDGRGNADFYIEGLSAAPGTADASSGLFSRSRDNGVFDPKPIPALTGRKREGAALHEFIEGVVRDEFQGAPPGRVIEALVAYVAALDAGACPPVATPRRPGADMVDLGRALRAGAAAAETGDAASADFLLASARIGLARIHERFAGPAFAAERATLKVHAARLHAIRTTVDPAAMRAEAEKFDETAKALENRRRGSLYDAKALRRALKDEG